MRLAVSIGIMAYNEGNNIGNFLKSLLSQKTGSVKISEIIIVSSGSTDGTNKIINQFKKKNRIIKVYIQRIRLGKVSAVNIFLSKAKEKILVLASADLILKADTLEKLVSPLKDHYVGIVGCRPIPLNDTSTFFGYANQLYWELHHQLSLNKPKMGEMIAFRKIFKQISPSTIVDEANIEPLIRCQGYKAVYAPLAIVFNKGAENLADYICQRRRNYMGHLYIKYNYGYAVSSMNTPYLFLLVVRSIKFHWHYLFWMPVVLLLEAYCRFLGVLDFKLSIKKHAVWTVAASTKKLNMKRANKLTKIRIASPVNLQV